MRIVIIAVAAAAAAAAAGCCGGGHGLMVFVVVVALAMSREEARAMLVAVLGDAPLLVPRHVLQRPHVVQAVGEFDDQHANVAGCVRQHLGRKNPPSYSTWSDGMGSFGPASRQTSERAARPATQSDDA